MTKENEKEVAAVNLQTVISHCAEVASSQQTYQAKQQALQQWVNNANAEISLQSTEKAKTELGQKYQAELNQRKQALEIERAQALQAVDAKITKAISDVAAKGGYKFVYARTALLYGGVDITGDVIEALGK